MKTLFLMLGILVYLGVSQAQSYTPMLDNQNEWQVLSCYGDDCFKDVYYTNGDTIVNGQNHKILDGYHYISRTFLLREELSSKKVYLKTHINNQQNEYLLYNFSMQEGDSIEMKNPITPFPEDGGFYTLDSIRPRPILHDHMAKFYFFSPSVSNQNEIQTKPIWVEGVGSLSLVTAPGGHPNYFGVGQVSCFFKNGSLFYFDGDMQDSCDAVMKNVEMNNLLETKFYVANSIGHLQTNIPIQSLDLFSSQGQLIRQESIGNKTQYQVDFKNLPTGIYILRVKSIQNQMKSIKFILQ
ncbi:T9SS type A sorting domain-containing protein [Moheibacter stercoris]|uniref:Secretion system C-terminal sorting domain-containing protein n=1 Tax=Moheibacter stercoris TaxID=1628251 RepID=A0ABV2LQY3_9FLAO